MTCFIYTFLSIFRILHAQFLLVPLLLIYLFRYDISPFTFLPRLQRRTSLLLSLQSHDKTSVNCCDDGVDVALERAG
jgi:hypothetical protein